MLKNSKNILKNRLIFFHLLNDYSGSPRILSQVVDTCTKRGYDTEVHFGCGGEGFLSQSGNKQECFSYRRFDNGYLTFVSYIYSQLLLFFRFLKYKNQNVTVYINTLLPFGAALAARLIGKPVCYHVHETSLKPEILKKFLKLFVKLTASKVVYVSHMLKEKEYIDGVDSEVIYNSLSADFLEQGSGHKYSCYHNGKFNVLMVCSLRAYKGVNEFIKIAESCVAFSVLHFKLVLNCSDQERMSYFSNVSVPSNVVVYSRQTDLYPFYKEASLVLNLSRVDEWVETFGLTLLEAMSFSVPVIAPPVGGPVEIITDGKEGFLISSYDIGVIAKLIIELSSNESKCKAISYNARLRAKDFDPDVFEQKILNVIETF